MSVASSSSRGSTRNFGDRVVFGDRERRRRWFRVLDGVVRPRAQDQEHRRQEQERRLRHARQQCDGRERR